MTGWLSRRDALLRAAGVAAASMVPAVPLPASPRLSTSRSRARRSTPRCRRKSAPGKFPALSRWPRTKRRWSIKARSASATWPRRHAMSTDTVFRIASMVKLLTSVAALQLVERGKLKLDEPAGNIDPTLASPQVLAGFDAKGVPQLRPAHKPITLRNLLTHTSGFSYPLWDPNVVRYLKAPRGDPALAAPAADVRARRTDGPMAAVSTMSARWLRSPAGKASIAISANTSPARSA